MNLSDYDRIAAMVVDKELHRKWNEEAWRLDPTVRQPEMPQTSGQAQVAAWIAKRLPPGAEPTISRTQCDHCNALAEGVWKKPYAVIGGVDTFSGDPPRRAAFGAFTRVFCSKPCRDDWTSRNISLGDLADIRTGPWGQFIILREGAKPHYGVGPQAQASVATHCNWPRGNGGVCGALAPLQKYGAAGNVTSRPICADHLGDWVKTHSLRQVNTVSDGVVWVRTETKETTVDTASNTCEWNINAKTHSTVYRPCGVSAPDRRLNGGKNYPAQGTTHICTDHLLSWMKYNELDGTDGNDVFVGKKETHDPAKLRALGICQECGGSPPTNVYPIDDTLSFGKEVILCSPCLPVFLTRAGGMELTADGIKRKYAMPTLSAGDCWYGPSCDSIPTWREVDEQTWRTPVCGNHLQEWMEKAEIEYGPVPGHLKKKQAKGAPQPMDPNTSNSYPPAPQTSFTHRLKEEAYLSARLIAAAAVRTTIKNAYCLAVDRSEADGKSAPAGVKILRDLMDTELGDVALDLVLGFALPIIPNLDPRFEQIASGFRINGEVKLGSHLIASFQEPIFEALKNIDLDKWLPKQGLDKSPAPAGTAGLPYGGEVLQKDAFKKNDITAPAR